MALSWIRDAGVVFSYLEYDAVQERLQNIVADVRHELQLFEQEWNAVNPQQQINLLALWDEWITAYFQNMTNLVAAWASRRLSELQRHWQNEVAAWNQRIQANNSPQNQQNLSIAQNNLNTIVNLGYELELDIDSTDFFDFL